MTIASAVAVALADSGKRTLVISTDPASTIQVTRRHRPGSGHACSTALLSSSLTTSAASPMAASKTPAASRSAVICRRATATLAGAQGSSTSLASLTP